MIESREDQFLWVEKYRPQKIDDCVLPEALKKTFKEYIARGELPSFLFSGTAGVGKTTVAKALCNEIGAEYIMINGSDEGRSIDILRTTVKSFASTVSLTDSKKVVIIDEADYMNAQSVQPALRSMIEEFSANCRFIFTCNFKNRIIEPLHSRCAVVEFKIDSGILVNMSEESFRSLIKMLKEKDFTEVRKWITKQSDADTTTLFRELYDTATQHMEANSIPQLILILADYQYKAAFVADHELNMMAALTEVMAQCKFK